MDQKRTNQVMIAAHGLTALALMDAMRRDGGEVVMVDPADMPITTYTPPIKSMEFPIEAEPVNSTDFLRNFGRKRERWEK